MCFKLTIDSALSGVYYVINPEGEKEVPLSDREDSTMATITRKNALSALVSAFADDATRVAIEDFMGVEVAEAVAEVMAKMLAQAEKPSKPNGPTKAQRENEPLLASLVEWASTIEGEPTEDNPLAGCFTSKDVTEHVRNVLTTQKAVKLCGTLIERGVAERVRVGSKVAYRLV